MDKRERMARDKRAKAKAGRVERVLDPTAKPGARCKPCTDERRDQPIEGLTIHAVERVEQAMELVRSLG